MGIMLKPRINPKLLDAQVIFPEALPYHVVMFLQCLKYMHTYLYHPYLYHLYLLYLCICPLPDPWLLARVPIIKRFMENNSKDMNGDEIGTLGHAL